MLHLCLVVKRITYVTEITNINYIFKYCQFLIIKNRLNVPTNNLVYIQYFTNSKYQTFNLRDVMSKFIKVPVKQFVPAKQQAVRFFTERVEIYYHELALFLRKKM